MTIARSCGLDAAALRGGGLVDSLADAGPVEVVATSAVDRGVTAGRVIHPLFTAADGAQPEILRQETIAALLALEQEILERLLAAVEELVDDPAAAAGAQNRHRFLEYMKTGMLRV